MELPTGQLIHVWKDGKLHQEKSRYAMQVLYDDCNELDEISLLVS
jgi:hypothetical protein